MTALCADKDLTEKQRREKVNIIKNGKIYS